MTQTRFERVALFTVIGAVLVVVGILGFSREYFSFGTETDYLGSFVEDARHFLAGTPPLLEYHPPLYPLLISVIQRLVDDWLMTGLLVSFASSGVVLFASFALFRNLLSSYAGWGALSALLVSPAFLAFSVQATSDVFFTALYMTSLLLAVAALRSNARWLWIATGLVAGLTLLTRTNGLALSPILFGPLLSPLPLRRRFGLMLYAMLGASVPLIGWQVYGSLIGASFGGGKSFVGIAATYFARPGDIEFADAVPDIERRFSSLWQVISYDPAYLLQSYVANLARLPREILSGGLLVYPLNLLAACALTWLILTARVTNFWYMLVLLLGHVLLVNVTEFNERYYLFLVPLLGAALGEFWRYLQTLVPKEPLIERYAKGGLSYGLLALAPIGFAVSTAKAYTFVHMDDKELAEVVPQAQRIVHPGSVVVTRKPHLGFYTDSATPEPPNGDLAGLRRYLDEVHTGGAETYVYYGSAERRLRPQFASLSMPERAPPWLQTLAASHEPGEWVLYEYVADRP